VPVGEVDAAAALGQEDLLTGLARFSGRLASCRTYEETTQVALDALDDLFGFGHAILLGFDGAAMRLFAIASAGYPSSAVGAEVALGAGLIGSAAKRLRLVIDANVARSRTMAAAVTRSRQSDGHEIPLPGLPSARSAAAVPLLVGEHLLGILYLESERTGAFGGDRERLLSIVGANLAAALAARSGGSTEEHGELVRATAPPAIGAPLDVAYYQADDTVLCNSGYIVKGVPGRILWSLLRTYAASGRTQFTNRELRLDEALGLPAGNDNLEARLLVLRRRLDERACGIRLEHVGRGRLELAVEGPMRLSEIPTEGPMRRAHEHPVSNS
jgi:adenylate cyclase